MVNELDKYSNLGELIFASLNDTASGRELLKLQRILAKSEEARRYYQMYLSIYAVLRCEGVLGSDLARSPQFNHDSQFLTALAEYEKYAPGVEVERTSREEKPLSREERRRRIEAFIKEQRRRLERERALQEQQVKARLQEKRRIQMKKIRRSQRIAKLRRTAKKTWKYSKITAAAAVLVFFGYIGYLCIQPVPVATLTDSADARWENPDFSGKLNTRLLPGPMKLVNGYVQITFEDGTEVIVEAPTEIELESPGSTFLKQGKITVKVSPQARDFTVNTPTASMVDLGTEFGVEVSEDGSSILQVFRGAVSFTASRMSKLGQTSRIVKAGSANRVTSGSEKIQDIDNTKTLFVRNMPSSYEAVVRQSKPVAYWQFNKEDTETCLNSIDKNTFTGRYIGDIEINESDLELGGGKQNHELLIHNRKEYMIVEGISAEKLQQQGFSIVLWFKPSTAKEQTIITVETKSGQQGWLSRYLAMTPERRLVFNALSDLYDFFGTEDEETKTREVVSEEKVQIGRWHHIAVTLSENRIHLFVDGQQKGSLSGRTNQFLNTDLLWYICTGPDIEPEKNEDFVNREVNFAIDELAVYDRVLSPREIKKIYNSFENGKQD